MIVPATGSAKMSRRKQETSPSAAQVVVVRSELADQQQVEQMVELLVERLESGGTGSRVGGEQVARPSCLPLLAPSRLEPARSSSCLLATCRSSDCPQAALGQRLFPVQHLVIASPSRHRPQLGHLSASGWLSPAGRPSDKWSSSGPMLDASDELCGSTALAAGNLALAPRSRLSVQQQLSMGRTSSASTLAAGSGHHLAGSLRPPSSSSRSDQPAMATTATQRFSFWNSLASQSTSPLEELETVLGPGERRASRAQQAPNLYWPSQPTPSQPQAAPQSCWPARKR